LKRPADFLPHWERNSEKLLPRLIVLLPRLACRDAEVGEDKRGGENEGFLLTYEKSGLIIKTSLGVMLLRFFGGKT